MVTARRKPYYFGFSCLESGGYLAAVIFWLSLSEMTVPLMQESAPGEAGSLSWTVWVWVWGSQLRGSELSPGMGTRSPCSREASPADAVRWIALLFGFFVTTGSLTREEAGL